MLVLLRHGEAVGNAEGRLLGRIDSPLTDRGRKQAERLASLLDPAATISRVIASPLARARSTAEALGLDIPIETDDRWTEVDYGSYDGELLSGVPSEVWRSWRADPGYRPPGGETLAELGVRVRSACEELFAADGSGARADSDVVVVSHVSPIKGGRLLGTRSGRRHGVANVAGDRLGDRHRVGGGDAGAAPLQPRFSERRGHDLVATLLTVKDSATRAWAPQAAERWSRWASFSASEDPRGVLVEMPSWLVGARRKRRPGILWALVPLVTLGLGAAPSFVYVALRYHRPRFVVPAAAYALVMTGAVTLLALGSALSIGLGTALLLGCTGVATAHTLAVRRDVAVERDDNDLHVAAARERLRRRAEARKIATGNPKLAHELGIGRPDLVSTFDDGGLVDVNHSPLDVIAGLPGIDVKTAERIVMTRSELGGFTSVDELSVTLDLPPAQLDGIADRLLFLKG